MRTKAAYPWPFFAAMAASLFLFVSFQALFPTLPLYIISIGGSPADNGLASWAFALAAVLSRPLAGVLADRWGRRPVLVVGALVFGGGPLLYTLTSSVPWLLGARAAHGVGMALFSTSYQAFVADLLPPGRYGEGLGLANTASVVTMVAAPLLGEWLAHTFGFRWLFLALGVIGGMGMVIALTLLAQGPFAHRGTERLFQAPLGAEGETCAPPLPPTRVGLRLALEQRCVRVGTLGMALLGVPFGAFVTFLPLLADSRDISGTGWVFAAYAFASALVQPAAGRIADRLGSGRTILGGLALASVAAAGFAVAGAWWPLLGLSGLFGIGYGAARAGLDACVQGGIEPALRGSSAAVQYAAHDLSIGLGGWTLGLLASSTGYGVMYATVSGIILLGLVIGGLALGWQTSS